MYWNCKFIFTSICKENTGRKLQIHYKLGILQCSNRGLLWHTIVSYTEKKDNFVSFLVLSVQYYVLCFQILLPAGCMSVYIIIVIIIQADLSGNTVMSSC